MRSTTRLVVLSMLALLAVACTMRNPTLNALGNSACQACEFSQHSSPVVEKIIIWRDGTPIAKCPTNASAQNWAKQTKGLTRIGTFQ